MDTSQELDEPLFAAGNDGAVAPLSAPPEVQAESMPPPPPRTNTLRRRVAEGRANAVAQGAEGVQKLRDIVAKRTGPSQHFSTRDRLAEEASLPGHPNLPLVEPDADDELLPCVVVTRGHPTAGEFCRGIFAATLQCCSWFFVLLVVVTGIVFYTKSDFFTDCRLRANSTQATADCLDAPLSAQLVSEECNSCATHYDGICDEPPESGRAQNTRRLMRAHDSLVQTVDGFVEAYPDPLKQWTGTCLDGTDSFGTPLHNVANTSQALNVCSFVFCRLSSCSRQHYLGSKCKSHGRHRLCAQ